MAACSVSPSAPDAQAFGHHESASLDMPSARPARLLVKPELSATARHASLEEPVKSHLHAGDTYGRSAHKTGDCMYGVMAVTVYQSQGRGRGGVPSDIGSEVVCCYQPTTSLYTCQPQHMPLAVCL